MRKIGEFILGSFEDKLCLLDFNQRKMRKIVDKFNTAAIYITHDLAVVSTMANKIGVLPMTKEDLLKTSDIISIHVVLNDKYKNLITNKELKIMKKSSKNSDIWTI